MKSKMLLLLSAGMVIGLIACGGDSKAETPEEAFLQVKECSAKNDYDALYDMMSKEVQQEVATAKLDAEKIVAAVEGSALEGIPIIGSSFEEKKKEVLAQYGVTSAEELQNMDIKAFFGKFVTTLEKEGDSILATLGKAELVSVNVAEDGKSATLTYKNPDGDEKNLGLVNEGAGWRLDVK